MSKTTTRRRQRPIRGGREQLPAAVEQRIWNEVERTARRFNVSRSFVVAVALADAMGVDLDAEDRYDKPREVKRRKTA
jgi:hypothetical protein